MHDREVEQRNLSLAWGLVFLFLLLFGGTVAIAFIYLAVD